MSRPTSTRAKLLLVGAVLVAGAVTWLGLALTDTHASPVTASIRFLPAKSASSCRAMLHSALLRRLPPAAHESPLRLRRIAQRVEQALCAGASTGAWYEIDLHLRRHEQTIIGCWATLLDRDRRPIRVPRVFFGPERFLVLDPLGGIQSGDLWMQPGHVARVQWMITPGDGLSTSDLRRVRGFTRPRCESIAPDQVPF